MNYYFIIVVITFALLLNGCISKVTEIDQISANNQDELSIWPYFSVKSIIDVGEPFVRRDGSIAWTNVDYNDNTAHRSSKDTLIEIYHSAPSCSPNAIGINSPVTLSDSKDENTIWGRMDYGEIYYTGDFPQEFTKPCSYSGENVYAFCSEKVGDPAKAVDDKRVVICINQQTDDAKLAEEIFKTFKWIK